MKFAGFHEIRNERPTIARNGKAYVLMCVAAQGYQ